MNREQLQQRIRERKMPPLILLQMHLREARKIVAMSDEEMAKTFISDWREARKFYKQEIARIEAAIAQGEYRPPRRSRAM